MKRRRKRAPNSDRKYRDVPEKETGTRVVICVHHRLLDDQVMLDVFCKACRVAARTTNAVFGPAYGSWLGLFVWEWWFKKHQALLSKNMTKLYAELRD